MTANIASTLLKGAAVCYYVITLPLYHLEYDSEHRVDSSHLVLHLWPRRLSLSEAREQLEHQHRLLACEPRP